MNFDYEHEGGDAFIQPARRYNDDDDNADGSTNIDHAIKQDGSNDNNFVESIKKDPDEELDFQSARYLDDDSSKMLSTNYDYSNSAELDSTMKPNKISQLLDPAMSQLKSENQTTLENKLPTFIVVYEDETLAKAAEIELENGELKLDSLKILYDNVVAIKFRNEENGTYRILAPRQNIIRQPEGGWHNKTFVLCYRKNPKPEIKREMGFIEQDNTNTFSEPKKPKKATDEFLCGGDTPIGQAPGGGAHFDYLSSGQTQRIRMSQQQVPGVSSDWELHMIQTGRDILKDQPGLANGTAYDQREFANSSLNRALSVPKAFSVADIPVYTSYAKPALSPSELQKARDRVGPKGVDEKMQGISTGKQPVFWCTVCKIMCNSQGDYDGHMIGRKHRALAQNQPFIKNGKIIQRPGESLNWAGKPYDRPPNDLNTTLSSTYTIESITSNYAVRDNRDLTRIYRIRTPEPGKSPPRTGYHSPSRTRDRSPLRYKQSPPRSHRRRSRSRSRDRHSRRHR